MELIKNVPINFKIKPISESTITCRLKTKATKYPIRIDFAVHIYYKKLCDYSGTSIANNVQSIYTSNKDDNHEIKLKTPKFDKYIKSDLLLYLVPGQRCDSVHIGDVKIVSNQPQIVTRKIKEMATVPNTKPKISPKLYQTQIAMKFPNIIPKVLPVQQSVIQSPISHVQNITSKPATIKDNKCLKVVFLSVNDWANVGWSYMQSARSVGIIANGYKTYPHIFKYPGELEIITSNNISKLRKDLKSADIVQVIHGKLPKINVDIKSKKVIIHHGGSAYRQSSGEFNNFWNKIAKATIIETIDLLHLGAIDEYFLPSPVDIDSLKPKGFYDGSRPLRIAHCPSIAVKKGTNTISNVLNSLKKEFNFDTYISEKTVPWQDHIGHVSKCDIYIDHISLQLNGKRYGEYGVSAREAAALGKIVISAHLGVSEYNKAFGDTKIIVSNTSEELKKNLIWILNQSPGDISRIQRETRGWVVSKHSYKQTGEKLKKLYQKILGVTTKL